MYRALVPLTPASMLSALLLPVTVSATLAASVALEHRSIAGASVYVITANLNDPGITVGVSIARGGLATSESFSGIVRRTRPIAAVTGTYFDTRSLLPVGTIVVDGVQIHRSAIGSAVSFLAPSSIIPGEGPQASRAQGTSVRFTTLRKGEDCSWDDARCGIRTGPRLLDAGRYALAPGREGFRHPGIFGSRTRMALGLTTHNKLLLVAVRTPVTFARTATILKALGAVDAVCLDGGTSSAMYYRGRVVCAPGRRLTNLIEVREVRPQPVEPTVPTLVLTPEVVAHAGQWLVLRPANAQPNAAKVPLLLGHEFHPLQPETIRLRLTKRSFAFSPVDGAKLTGLQRTQHSKHLVHVAPYV